MIRRCLMLLMAVCVIIGFSACTKKEHSNKPETNQINPDEKSFSLPIENIRAFFPSLHGVAATSSNGYYSGIKALKYTDIASKQTITLCVQPGCDHSDSSCQAWLGENVISMCEYQGFIYATVTEADGSLAFLKKDITTAKRTIIERWDIQGENDYSVDISLGVFSDGKCILYLTKTTYQFSEQYNMMQMVSDTQAFVYDLHTGKRESLPEEFSNWNVYAMCGNRLLVAYSSYRFSEQEYYDLYGENGDYETYLYNYIPAEIRMYDMETGESKVIATEDEGLVLTTDFCNSYGYVSVYRLEDDICLFDLESQESSIIISMDRVINFWLMDHKVFLIQSFSEQPPYDGYYIYYMDMDGGDLIRLENEGATDSMHFSITWEGNDFFGGNYLGSAHLIRKEDFYAESYDKAWSGGY